MKIIIKEPGKIPEIQEIDDELETCQSIVGGYIESVGFVDDMLMICNEEGKLEGLPFNFMYYDDYIVGTVFFVGIDGEDFASLTDEQIKKIENIFKQKS